LRDKKRLAEHNQKRINKIVLELNEADKRKQPTRVWSINPPIQVPRRGRSDSASTDDDFRSGRQSPI
jgi:hypothetical protein